MRRTVIIAGGVSFLMAFLGTVLALTLVLPAVADAQGQRIRAEQVTVVNDNGVERVQVLSGPEQAGGMRVYDTNGTLRLSAVTGANVTGTNVPDVSSFTVRNSAGVLTSVFGLGRGAQGNSDLTNILVLNDMQERVRIRLRVGSDGTPSMEMLDAAGNVTWRAP
jgi:hypothetical protein